MREWANIKVHVPHPTYPRLKFLQPRTFLYQRTGFAHPTPGIQKEFIEYPAIPWLTRPLNASTLSRYLLPRFRQQQPDIVLSYCVYPDACGAVIAARKLSIPVVIGCLGSDVRRISDPLSKQMVRYALRNADYVLGVSNELVARAVTLGASPHRSRAISNGCDGSIFHTRDRAGARHQLGIAPDAKLIAFTGRLVELKGVQELLAAFFRLAAADPSLELVLIGDGPLLKTYQKHAVNSGFAQRVRFLGNTPPAQVASWLAASDLFCLPSHSKGCPNAVIEALACGRPVVATEVGGIPDLIDARNGILVPPSNSNALQSALRTGLSRSWDAQAIAASFGRTWRDMAADTFEVCQSVLEQKRRQIQPMSYQEEVLT
jgi:glycosyltransferase involved in cell wall biosynthesis